MADQGERLTFRFEPGDDALCVHPQLDDLEGYQAAYRLVLTRLINRAAAAFTDWFDQFVAANAVAGLFDGRGT